MLTSMNFKFQPSFYLLFEYIQFAVDFSLFLKTKIFTNQSITFLYSQMKTRPDFIETY